MKYGVTQADLKLAVQKILFKVYWQHNFNKKFLIEVLSVCSDLHPALNSSNNVYQLHSDHPCRNWALVILVTKYTDYVAADKDIRALHLDPYMQRIMPSVYLITRNSNFCEDEDPMICQ